MPFERFRAMFNRIEERLLAAILLSMFVTLVLQVFSRYVFNYPLAWTEELARYLFIWLVFVGASQAMRYRDHIAIGLLVDNVPEIARRIAAIAMNVMVAVFLLLLVVQGWRIVQQVAPLPSTALGVSMALVYLPVPLAAAVMLVRTVAETYCIARHGAPEIGAKSL